MRKTFEGCRLARVRLYERVRHGAEDRNVIELAGQYRRCAAEARQVRCTCRQQARLSAMGPAQPEIHKQLARCSQHTAHGLGCDQGLKVQQIDYARFHELRLRDRRCHTQDRLVREEHRAFRHRMDVALEAEVAEIIDELRVKAAGRG